MTKVLCLCGYTQSGAIFRNRLSAIRKQCSSSTTFKFLDPPHIVHAVNLPEGSLVSYDSTASANGGGNDEELPRAWFFAKDVEGGYPGQRRYEGLDETWKLLKDTLEEEQFDVVLGFSQGAGLAGCLASLLCLPTNTIKHPPFKLAILVSGFAMQDNDHAIYPADGSPSPAPTLQIIGRNDTIVSTGEGFLYSDQMVLRVARTAEGIVRFTPAVRSQSLVDKFENPQVEVHDGGHYVPSKANFRKFFKAIFDSFEADETGASSANAWRDVSMPNSASGTSTPTSASGGKL